MTSTGVGSGPALPTPWQQTRFPYGTMVQAFLDLPSWGNAPQGVRRAKSTCAANHTPGCQTWVCPWPFVQSLCQEPVKSQEWKGTAAWSTLILEERRRGFVDALFKSMICFLLLVKEGSGSLQWLCQCSPYYYVQMCQLQVGIISLIVLSTLQWVREVQLSTNRSNCNPFMFSMIAGFSSTINK